MSKVLDVKFSTNCKQCQLNPFGCKCEDSLYTKTMDFYLKLIALSFGIEGKYFDELSNLPATFNENG